MRITDLNQRYHNFCILLSLLVLVGVGISCTGIEDSPREKVRLTEDWKFHLGDVEEARQPGYDDAGWRTLDLPHDWSIEGEFSDDHETGVRGGALPAGMGWYRKTFSLPESQSQKKTFINFDGVYRNSEVWINGHYLGKRPFGYISFQYELTPYLNYGDEENVIAVKVDNTPQPNSRWYTGSGIYRNVWMVSTGQVHVDHWGTNITTPKVTDESAQVDLQVKLRNSTGQNDNISVETAIIDSSGSQVAHAETSDLAFEDSLATINQDFTVSNPHRWSVDNPYLYKAVTTVYHDGRATDRYQTPLGIRTFRFDREEGFFLNGEPLKILGVNKHHDLGALGAAVNKRAIERQLELFKDMGVNAIRSAHNPPSPEFLELTDEMGFIVMDESFDVWAKQKMDADYHLNWDEWHRKDLRDMVLRDRNHPSVMIWSIGNEIRAQFDSTGISITRELVDIVKEHDTTRPVTSGLTENNPEKNFIYQSGALDLLGFNYKQDDYAELPERFPGEKFISTEGMCAMATRGYYEMPSDSISRMPEAHDVPLKNPNPGHLISAYDHISAYWGSTHEETWKVVKELDHMAGLFVWAGIDYLGEPMPYKWPSRSTYFGIIDMAGFPKDAYYMYQSEWTDKDVLHLLPHWNWEPGKTVDVWAYYNNADEVELYLNGESLGTRSKQGDDLHVMWRVEYQPGTLKAVSRKDGEVVKTTTVETAGEPAKIELTADRSQIKANGRDLSFVTVKVLDEDGNLVPRADNMINFDLKGPAKIAGVDNGYQASTEPFKADYRKAFNGKALAIIQSEEEGGSITLEAIADGLESDDITIESK